MAAASTSGRRLFFSSYGARVDVHALGEGVLTTVDDGYADFVGTSAAAPIVAGAAAVLQSIAIEAWERPLQPEYLRNLFVETGSHRIDPTVALGPEEHIGTQPDLRSALDALFEDMLYCADRNGDGVVSLAEASSSSLASFDPATALVGVRLSTDLTLSTNTVQPAISIYGSADAARYPSEPAQVCGSNLLRILQPSIR